MPNPIKNDPADYSEQETEERFEKTRKIGIEHSPQATKGYVEGPSVAIEETAKKSAA